MRHAFIACALAAAVQAGEPPASAGGWRDDFDAAQPDPAWTVAGDGDGGTVAGERGRLAIRGDQQRRRFLRRALGGPDPSDDLPLVITCRLSDSRRDGHPATLALGWSDREAVAITLGPGADKRPVSITAWTAGGADGAAQRMKGDNVSVDASGGHCRLVVTARMIAAWACRDGATWSRVAAVERTATSFAGAPRWLTLGRGWSLPARLSDGGNENDKGPAVFTADALHVLRAAPTALAPAPVTGGWDDLLRAWNGPAGLRGWQALGPLAPQIAGADLAFDARRSWPLVEGGNGGWQAVPEVEGADPTLVDVVRPAAGSKRDDVTFAFGVRLRATQASDELIAFDGMRSVEVWHNGWPVSGPHAADRDPLLPGRRTAMLHLAPGDNDVVVRLGNVRGRPRLSFSRAAGDAVQRAGALAACAAAFPDDPRRGDALAETALWWERAGLIARALTAWRAVAVAGDPLRAAAAAARLHALLGSGEAVLADCRALAAAGGADLVGDLAATALRAGDAGALALSALAGSAAGDAGSAWPDLLRAGLAEARGDHAARVAALDRAIAAAPAALRPTLACEVVEARLSPLRGQAAMGAQVDNAALRALLPAVAAACAGLGEAARAAAAPALAAAGAATDGTVALAAISRAGALAALADDPAGRELLALADSLNIRLLQSPGRNPSDQVNNAVNTLSKRLPAPAAARRRAAAWLAVSMACPDRPYQVDSELGRAAAGLIEAGDVAAGLVLARVIALMGSSNPGAQAATAGQIAQRLRGDGALARGRALVTQAERLLLRRPIDDPALRRSEVRSALPRLALALGEGAIAREEFLALSARLRDGEGEARLIAEFAEAERQAGEMSAALSLIERAAGLPGRDDNARDGLLSKRAEWAAGKIAVVDFVQPGDGVTVLETAERAFLDRDFERAAALWQRAGEDHGRGLSRIDGQRLVGIGEYAASRLRVAAAQEPDVLAAWRRQFSAPAAVALAQAGDDTALLAVVRAWRFAPAAATALQRLLARARDAGRHGEAAWACERLLRDHAGAGAPAAVLATLAEVLAASGERTRAQQALADLERLGGELTVAGRRVTAAAWAQGRRQRLASAGAMTAGAALRTPAEATRLSVRLPVVPIEEEPLWAAAPHPYRLAAARALPIGDAMLIASGDELHAIGLDGVLRWSTARPLGHLAPPLRQAHDGDDDHDAGQPVPALADLRPALAGDRVYARVTRRGPGRAGGAIEARRLSDGVLLWSNERDPATADLDVVSPPTATAGAVLALACEADAAGRLVAVAWDAGGRLRWRTALGAGASELLLRSGAYAVADRLAAPVVADGAVFVAGQGAVACLDLVEGVVRWLTPYQRAGDSADARWGSVLALRTPALILGADQLYCLPRDATAMIALRRGDGRVAWRRGWSGERALVGVTAGSAGELLIAQGLGVVALAAADGAQAWRWESPATLIGDAVLAGGEVLVSDSQGLNRLRPGDGTALARKTWSELGCPPIGHLAVGSGLITGTSDPLSGESLAVALGAAGAAQVRDLVGGAMTLTAGPPAAFGTLALRWRLPVTDSPYGAEILRADPADGGEVYVRLGSDLARVDPLAGRLVWRQHTIGNLKHLAVGEDLVLMLYERRLDACARADGRRRWIFVPPAGRRLDWQAMGRLGTRTVVACGEGERLWLLGADGVVLATHDFGGRIHAVTWSARGPLILSEDSRGLSVRGLTVDGAIDWQALLPLGGGHHDTGALADGDTLYVVAGQQAARFDLAKRTVDWGARHGANGEGRWRLARTGDVLVVVNRGHDDGGPTLVLDPASGRTLVRQPGAWEVMGDRLIGRQQRDDKPTLTVARRLSGDQVLWQVQQPKGEEHFAFAGAWRGRWLHLFGRQGIRRREGDSRRLAWRLHDSGTGAVSEEGELPVTLARRRPERWQARGTWAAPVGDLLLVASDEGLLAVTAAIASGPAAAPVAPVLPLRLEPLALAMAGEVPAVRPTLIAPQVTRAPLEADWLNVPVFRLDRAEDLRCAAPALWNGAADLAADIAVAWDGTRLHLRVVVSDDRVQTPGTGAALTTGDSLVVAIDAEGRLGDAFAVADQRNRPSRDLLLHAALVEGRPQFTQYVGDEAAAGVVRTECRIARTPRGLTYQLAIPWTPRDGRIARIGLDVVVLDWDGGQVKALEWGAGVHDGLRPRRFICIEFGATGAQLPAGREGVVRSVAPVPVVDVRSGAGR